jgi:hypothetical protein
VLSRHWEQALEPLRAAQWGARAAAWAGQSHPADALHYWRRVRDLVHGQQPSPEAAGLALGACLGILQSGSRVLSVPPPPRPRRCWPRSGSSERARTAWELCRRHRLPLFASDHVKLPVGPLRP